MKPGIEASECRYVLLPVLATALIFVYLGVKEGREELITEGLNAFKLIGSVYIGGRSLLKVADVMAANKVKE